MVQGSKKKKKDGEDEDGDKDRPKVVKVFKDVINDLLGQVTYTEHPETGAQEWHSFVMEPGLKAPVDPKDAKDKDGKDAKAAPADTKAAAPAPTAAPASTAAPTTAPAAAAPASAPAAAAAAAPAIAGLVSTDGVKPRDYTYSFAWQKNPEATLPSKHVVASVGKWDEKELKAAAAANAGKDNKDGLVSGELSWRLSVDSALEKYELETRVGSGAVLKTPFTSGLFSLTDDSKRDDAVLAWELKGLEALPGGVEYKGGSAPSFPTDDKTTVCQVPSGSYLVFPTKSVLGGKDEVDEYTIHMDVKFNSFNSQSLFQCHPENADGPEGSVGYDGMRLLAASCCVVLRCACRPAVLNAVGVGL